MFLTRWSLFSSHVKKLCHMYHMQSRAGILPSSCYKKSRGFLLALCLLSLKCHFCLYTWQKLLEIHPLYTHSRQKEREGQGANEYMLAMSIISRKSTQQLLHFTYQSVIPCPHLSPVCKGVWDVSYFFSLSMLSLTSKLWFY